MAEKRILEQVSNKTSNEITENQNETLSSYQQSETTEKNESNLKLKSERTLENQESSKLQTHPLGADTKATDLSIYSPIILSDLPEQTINSDSLPQRFWWGDVNGVNYLSWVLNQNTPQACSSDYAFAVLSALSDRINIKNNNIFRTSLAVQSVINCGVGSCETGGSFAEVLEHGVTKGFSEYGCNNYWAKTPEKADCDSQDRCMNCWGTAESFKCFPMSKYVNWYVKEHGRVSGSDSMKKEIWNRGPIMCRVMVSENFYYSYNGGVWKESLADGVPRKSQGVNVVGWGSNEDGEFWIAKNSWGTWWGESGYFRVPVGEGS